jgi:HSP20 family protein
MRYQPTLRTGRRVPTGSEFFSRFDNLLGDYDREFFGDDRTSAKSSEQNRARGTDVFADFSPAVDIEEANGMYMISADLPGLKEPDVKIEVRDRDLRISGERRREAKDEVTSYCERSYGRFVRNFTLPETVDPKTIEAHFENGVLRVVLPKAEAAAPQEVKIQTGSPKGLMDRFLHRDEAKRG